MAAAILTGIYVFPILLPWPGLVMMWVLILFGFALYWRAHILTKLASSIGGAGVEQIPVARLMLKMQQFNLTLLIMLAVQAFVGLFATIVYFEHGWFYTLFLTFEVVAFAFIMLDWLNDELEMIRFRSRQSTDRAGE